jgi:hypothetical protein
MDAQDNGQERDPSHGYKTPTYRASVRRRVPVDEPEGHERYPSGQSQLHESQFVDDEADEVEEEGSDDVPDGEDLAEFFGDIDVMAQISICRAYANYLSAKQRGSGRPDGRRRAAGPYKKARKY